MLGVTFEGLNRNGWLSDGDLCDAWVGSLLPGDKLEPESRWLEASRMEGERVVLRHMRPGDEGRYLESTTDPESMRWLATVPLARDSAAFRERLVRSVAAPSLGQDVEWTVADIRTDELVASVHLFDLGGLDYKSAEFGYWTHPDSRGRGLLTEALRLVLGHAFRAASEGGLGLERIHLGAGDGNEASQHVARAVGFTETGRDRRCYDLPDGSVVDLIRFDLLVSEWRR